MSKSDFRTVTFQELINEGVLEIGDGYRAKNEELGGTGPLFLRAGHVTDTHIDFEGVERFHASLTDKLKPKMTRVGDTIVTTKGNSTGRTSYVTPEMPAFVYSPHLSYWRSRDEAKVASGFLRYWSRSSEFTQQLSGMKASTDMAPYLSLTDQRRLQITLLPGNEQQAIACILGALDDKIELNRRRNRTVEATARAIFQSWFVDFDPVKAKAAGHKPAGLSKEIAALFPASFEESELGEIPKGWRVGTLGEVAENPRRGIAADAIPVGTPYIALEHMPRRSITLADWSSDEAIESNKFEFRKGEILFGKLRPYFHKVGIAPVNGVCSTDILVVVPKHSDWFGFAACHASSDAIIQHADRASTGTKMPRSNWNDLVRFQVVLPPVEIAKVFSGLFRVMVDRIHQDIAESRTLAAVRDALLPKLISGELRVQDAERIVGRAV